MAVPEPIVSCKGPGKACRSMVPNVSQSVVHLKITIPLIEAVIKTPLVNWRDLRRLPVMESVQDKEHVSVERPSSEYSPTVSITACSPARAISPAPQLQSSEESDPGAEELRGKRHGEHASGPVTGL